MMGTPLKLLSGQPLVAGKLIGVLFHLHRCSPNALKVSILMQDDSTKNIHPRADRIPEQIATIPKTRQSVSLFAHVGRCNAHSVHHTIHQICQIYPFTRYLTARRSTLAGDIVIVPEHKSEIDGTRGDIITPYVCKD